MLDQWRELLADDVADARRVLRELLDGPLRFTPVIDEGVRFDGFFTNGGILAGNVGVVRLASPAGTEANNMRLWRIPYQINIPAA